MGLYDASPESLEHWLYDRVHYMLSEDFKPNLWNVSPVLGSSFEYPNPDVLPDFEQPQPGLQSLAALNDEAKVVMANLGSALYMAGKSSKILLAAKVDGVGKVQVTSPRTGIIMVGEGLFFDGYFPPGTAADAPVKSAFRMATFFHEARHSDGNGKSLGFVHALCPEGHDYAGLNACDRSSNGAYSVGAAIEAHMASNCNDCSEQEREALRVMSLDSTSRIIPRKDGQPADRWDASPEGNRERP
jgi:hypothetical protein